MPTCLYNINEMFITIHALIINRYVLKAEIWLSLQHGKMSAADVEAKSK
jgi:hypothetical protein